MDAWRKGGMVDAPEVAVLRKRARGEALTPDEAALLAPTPETRARIVAMGPGVPHEVVMRELADRQRRGG